MDEVEACADSNHSWLGALQSNPWVSNPTMPRPGIIKQYIVILKASLNIKEHAIKMDAFILYI